MTTSQPSSQRFLYSLLGLSLAGVLVAWFTTFRLGAGLGTDSANYLAAAQNLADGQGLLMFNGLPLTHWAPAYSALLAGLHMLLGVDVFVIGWVLNILLFGVLIFLSGLLFRSVFGESSLFTYAGPLLILTSVPILSAAANISSDPLFLVIVLVFLLQGRAYLQQPSPRRLYGLGFLAVLGVFTRYAGLSLVITAALLVLAAAKGSAARRLLRAALFGLLASLPILAWAYFHNYALTGSFFGNHGYVFAAPLQNLLLIPEKVAAWFVPDVALRRLPALFLSEYDLALRGLWAALALVGVLFALSTPAARKQFFASLSLPAVLPNLVFLFGYCLILVFTSSYSQLRFTGFDRIHAILLPSLLCLIFLAVRHLPQKLKGILPPPAWRLVLLVICLGLLALTGYRTYKYAHLTSEYGDVNYNFVNTSALRESALVTYLQAMPIAEDERIVSNNQALVWFYVRQRIDRIPRADSRQGWPLEGRGYMVWLKGQYHYLPGLISDFSQEGWLQLVFSDEFGDVYRFDR